MPAAVARAELYAGARHDQFLLCAAAFLRSVVIGMTGVLLALHLNAAGWDLRTIGALVSAGLAGNAAATLLVSFRAGRWGILRTLLVLGVLNVLGLLALGVLRQVSWLFVAAIFGMVNGLGRDRGPAYALEQAILPETTTPDRRTFLLAWYSMALDIALGLGSLAAGLAHWFHRLSFGVDESFRACWLLGATLLLVSLACYGFLSLRGKQNRSAAQFTPSPETRHRVFKLAALTGMDSLGGGFLSGALLSYWFFHRFEMSVIWLAWLFFAARIANAASHLAAAWLALRFGLLNTMVFTHIPSSLFLIAVPFAPSAGWAVALFLAREALVEMDVPTRQSYILAVVPPEARSYASGITTFTRNAAYAAAPGLAALGMSAVTLSLPLFLGGGIKIAYDVLLYFSFRRVKPPEEK